MSYRRYIFGILLIGILYFIVLLPLYSSNSIGCNAFDKDEDNFLAYCESTSHGHYDHAAFLFNLEKGLKENVLKANILFLGSSRIQFAFSTKALSKYSVENPTIHPYLLGFGYVEQDIFSAKILATIQPNPKVLVINVDPFFAQNASPHAHRLLSEPFLEERNAWIKKSWHSVSTMACNGTLGTIGKHNLCGSKYTVYRSIKDGRWIVPSINLPLTPVRYLPGSIGDTVKITEYTNNAIKFLQPLSIDRHCVVMTAVPSPYTNEYIARNVADNLGVSFIAPHLPNLMTFDGHHLDTESAERWSNEFLLQLKPIINSCL
jgi:hypothetical protein